MKCLPPLLWLLILLLPTHALAVPSLVASLSRQQLSEAEATTLTLTLTDAHSRHEPAIEPVLAYFDLLGQQRVASVHQHKGQRVQAIKWHYQLRPKRAGRLVIPSITLSTDAGQLISRPLYLTITADKAGRKALEAEAAAQQQARQQAEKPAARLATRLNQPQPYVGQVVLLDVTLYRGSNITEAQLQEPKGDGLRVEKIGQPSTDQVEMEGGFWTSVTARFAVAGLTPGQATIEPAELNGYQLVLEMPELDGTGLSTADLLAGMLQGMRANKPFTMATSPIPMAIRPIPPAWTHGLRNWLPAWRVDMQQRSQGTHNARQGDPITRDITVIVQGVFPESLPDLEALQRKAAGKAWQIYASPPERDSQLDAEAGTIVSYIRQSFTYVPLEHGAQALPAIQLPWWSLSTDSPQQSDLPAIPVDVAQNSRMDKVLAAHAPDRAAEAPPPPAWRGLWSLALAGVLLLAGGIMLLLRSKPFIKLSPLTAPTLKKRHKPTPAKPSTPHSTPNLSQARTPAEALAAVARIIPPSAIHPGEPLSTTARRHNLPALAVTLEQLEALAYAPQGASQHHFPTLLSQLTNQLPTSWSSSSMASQTLWQSVWNKLNP